MKPSFAQTAPSVKAGSDGVVITEPAVKQGRGGLKAARAMRELIPRCLNSRVYAMSDARCLNFGVNRFMIGDVRCALKCGAI